MTPTITNGMRAALARGLEDRELADEPAGQRDAGEGEQEQREHHADKRIAAAQAGPPRHGGVLLAVGIADQADDGERADRAETVGEQIEQRRRQRRPRCRRSHR